MSKYHNVVRRSQFHMLHFVAYRLQQATAVVLVKDVMMHSSMQGVAKHTLTKCCIVSSYGIAREVMQLKHLLDVGRIVFSCPAFPVFHHVAYRCRGTTVIEGFSIVGENHDQGSTRLYHPNPLSQRFDRIRNVFKIMRGEQEIIAMARNPS